MREHCCLVRPPPLLSSRRPLSCFCSLISPALARLAHLVRLAHCGLQDNSGIFIYQSMSGRGPTCAFEGEITMVPGSIQKPTGEPFQVAVARFPLEAGADEFLF
jgi:hypothetical protein